eukprot:5776905-Alexandrium_andersonii.AAC.1
MQGLKHARRAGALGQRGPCVPQPCIRKGVERAAVRSAGHLELGHVVREGAADLERGAPIEQLFG